VKFCELPQRLRQPERPREQVSRQPAWPPQLRMQTLKPLLHCSSQSAIATLANRLTTASIAIIRIVMPPVSKKELLERPYQPALHRTVRSVAKVVASQLTHFRHGNRCNNARDRQMSRRSISCTLR
jgi:hypothetical protein